MHSSRDLQLLGAFAIELKMQRRLIGISQEELAHRSGVDRTFVARLEVAQNQPSLSVLFSLSKGLGVQPETLVEKIRQRLEQLSSSAIDAPI
jgi:transcriptional regulator with XRE-family HTH domain